MRTERTQTLPSFHTHVIGSLPRPKLVLDLLSRRDQTPTDRYTRTMDEMVAFAIRLQEEAGIDVVSDGEWRRSSYIMGFLGRLGACEQVRRYQHQGESKVTDVIVRRMAADDPIFVRDAEFLAAHTDRRTKFALPSPFLIAVRYWHENHSAQAYPTFLHALEHLSELLRSEALALVEAGIDVIQLDDPALTYYCDRALISTGETHDERLRRDWDTDRQVPEAIAAINHVVEGLNAEVHLHCFHSVYKRRSDVTGDYKPLLPYLADAKVDRLNLEFAYQGTGSVDDLELLPEHLGVGMGVDDVRTERPQSIDEMETIGAAGTQFVSPDRISLNPDCGFAPAATEPPSIDEAYEKLCRLSETAGRLRKRFGA